MGSDFVATSSNRTFSLPLHQYEVCECLRIIQDDVTEGDEVFYLTLTSTNPQVRATGAVVHIVDDDGKIYRLPYFNLEVIGCINYHSVTMYYVV